MEARFYHHQMVEMAQYVAELTRQGCAYCIRNNGDNWTVEVTGF